MIRIPITLFLAVTVVAAVAALLLSSCTGRQPYRAEVFVPGHGFHGVHGLAFDHRDRLYAGSVLGRSIYLVDTRTGESETYLAPPLGMADDLEFGPDGTLVWTSVLQGKIHARKEHGPVKVLASGFKGINSIAFGPRGRLFATEVFDGDALYEIDRWGRNPPRKIAENLGGLNGFDFGPDGLLYGPLWFKGEVVSVDVDSGEITTVVGGFKVPAAVNFDSRGNLWVLDSGRGEVVRVDLSRGAKEVVCRLKTAMDNLAIDSRDRIFVTVMAENAIYEIDAGTGTSRVVKAGKLGFPADLAVWSEDGRQIMYVADIFAVRSIDLSTGEIKDLSRFVEDELEYPSGIDVSSRFVHVTSPYSGVVQTLDRESGRILKTLRGFVIPTDVLDLEDGRLLVAQLGAGNLLLVTGDGEGDREVVVSGLGGPVGLVHAREGSIYVSLGLEGEVIRLNLRTRETETIVSGLDQPEGIDVLPDGRLVLVEVGKRRVIAVDPGSGRLEVLAERLPLGLAMPLMIPAPGITNGVAVTEDAIYVSCDLEDAIYALRKNS